MSLLLLFNGGVAPVTGTASWIQTQSWDATAQVANPVIGTATFDQATATWASVASERFEATGAFLQAAAEWNAIAAETIIGSGEWVQAAAEWFATDLQPITGTATFEQAPATWAASGSAIFTVAARGGFQRLRRLPEIRLIGANASFEQRPATWSARITVENDEAEELLLVGVL